MLKFIFDRKPGSSMMTAIFLIINSTLGTGILNLPSAYKEAGGLYVSISVSIFFAIITIVTYLIFGHYRNKCDGINIEDVMGKCCGHWAKRVVRISTITFLFAESVAALVAVGDQLEKVIDFFAMNTTINRQSWYFNRRFTISLVSVVFAFPLSLVRDISFLKYSSFIGVFAQISILLYIFIGYFVLPLKPVVIKNFPNDFSSILKVVPAVLFTYHGHVVTVATHYSMRDKENFKKYTIVIICSVIFLLVVNTSTGVFGYLSFGEAIKPNIVLNYEPNLILLFCYVLLAIKILTNYPAISFCARVTFISILESTLSPQKFDAFIRYGGFYITAVLWYLLSLFFGLFTPDISYAIGLVAGVAAIYIICGSGYLILTSQIKELGQKKGYSHEDLSLITINNGVNSKPSARDNPKFRYFKIAISILFISFGFFVFGLATGLMVEKIVAARKD